ncbi:MAG TPA: PrsW family intramembrane metalloprotease [Chloroflexi bacterium]|nr:PrsW family intramembrane metalloprotease [Chloroflexota bacterium]HBY06688.1 PrsW family intramembrane metalloprotease [Chloroflexota bacterium]
MGFLASIFFGFAPMLAFAWFVYLLDRYEKEPKILLGVVFVWGALVAAGFAFIVNTTLGMGVYVVTNSEAITEFATGSLIAPPVEEILKGLAVLVVFFIFRKEFDSVLDGIVYAGIVALGFAATENTYYIYNYGYLEEGWAGLFTLTFVRVILVGWQHPFYTAFFGIGLATARLNRSIWVKLLAPTLGLFIGIVFHSLHNTLATVLDGLGGLIGGTLFDWGGWFFMFLVILWAIRDVQKRVQTYLRADVQAGIITPRQYRTACSSWAQAWARTAALFSGQHRDTVRFYQLCGELAHKKYQYAHFGDEGGNLKIINQTEAELAQLSPRARS